MPSFRAPRGTYDILPGDQPYWSFAMRTAAEVASRFGYGRIDTPVFEATDLFERGVGDATDIVQKEMYTFEDHGGDLMPLRPERRRGGQADSCPGKPGGTAGAGLAGGDLAPNVHVLGRATRVTGRLADGRIVASEIVGRDPLTDIALIKVAVDLPVLPIGPEPPLAAPVCAIGNQFGLGLSVTCGVVSAVHRSGTGFNPIEDFIQTDATVNPGGSGGALIDAEGRLVGLVSAIFTKKTDANIGVNFAASMRLVLRVAEDLRDHGRVRRGKSGLLVEDLTREERATTAGVRITRITPESAAAAAGLAVDDIITAMGGRAVTKGADVSAAVYLHRIGEAFEIAYLRAGEARTATLVLKP